jgi:hypothetical protein
MANLEKIYFINAGKKGTFAESGQHSTSPADVDELFKYLDAKDIEKLIIYFHGGLVSETNGMAAAGLMKSTFASPGSKRHVVTFVWETGPMETVTQNLDDLTKLAAKEVFNEALKFVIKIVAKKLGMEDARGGGEYLADETIGEEKSKIAPFENLDKVMSAKGGGGFTLDEDNEDEFYARLEIESRVLIKAEGSDELKNFQGDTEEVAKGGLLTVAIVVAKIAFAVLKRYYNKSHHDFYPTVMEEAFKLLYVNKIGTWGWTCMKEKAEEMFSGNENRTGDDLHAGTYFLKGLNTHYLQRLASGKKFEIELIGHSAGSIVICNMLDSTMSDFNTLCYNNVFFLAPACRTDYFLSKGKPAMDQGHIKKFKLFTMKQENEKKDHCIPYVYTHSLLYMVSGLFEVPDTDAKIMGLHEQFSAGSRYANFPELNNLKAFIGSNQLVLSDDVANPDASMRSNSFKHGDFDNDPVTLKSILNSI